MEAIFKQWTFYLAAGIEAGAAVVIALAVIDAIIRSLTTFFKSATPQQHTKEQIRLHLGRWLALGLEFELAADILRTAIAPTWNEIGQLAAIIVVRTVLNFFLQRDIDKAAERESPMQSGVTRSQQPDLAA
jgi:uncharacterized membrane protein